MKLKVKGRRPVGRPKKTWSKVTSFSNMENHFDIYLILENQKLVTIKNGTYKTHTVVRVKTDSRCQ